MKSSSNGKDIFYCMSVLHFNASHRCVVLQDTKQLFHPVSAQCLDCDPAQKEIFMTHCDESISTQKWEWGRVNVTQAKIEWDVPKV